jgi:hypothetical protein
MNNEHEFFIFNDFMMNMQFLSKKKILTYIKLIKKNSKLTYHL